MRVQAVSSPPCLTSSGATGSRCTGGRRQLREELCRVLAQEAGASGLRIGVYPSDLIVTKSAYSSLVVPAVPLV